MFSDNKKIGEESKDAIKNITYTLYKHLSWFSLIDRPTDINFSFAYKSEKSSKKRIKTFSFLFCYLRFSNTFKSIVHLL